MYKLDRYVVQRDFEGNVLRAIVKETVSIETLPEEIVAVITTKSVAGAMRFVFFKSSRPSIPPLRGNRPGLAQRFDFLK